MPVSPKEKNSGITAPPAIPLPHPSGWQDTASENGVYSTRKTWTDPCTCRRFKPDRFPWEIPLPTSKEAHSQQGTVSNCL